MLDSPWLAFFLALFAGQCAVTAFSQMLRTINIAIRGWPPPYLDADGDFPKPEADKP